MKTIALLLMLWFCFLQSAALAGTATERDRVKASGEMPSSGKKAPSKKSGSTSARKTIPAGQPKKSSNSGTRPVAKPAKKTASPSSALSPASGAVLENGFVGFTWPRDIGNAPFQLQVAKDRNFTSLVVDVTEAATSFVTTAELGPGVYYWRVQGS